MRCFAAYPGQIDGFEPVSEQQRMVMSLHDDQPVFLHVLLRDIPGVAVTVPGAADAQPLALAQCVERQPHVFADPDAVRRDDIAGVGRQVAV